MDDLVRDFDIIIHKGEIGKTYNIGSDLEYKNIEIWETLVKIFREKKLLEDDNAEHAGGSKYLQFVEDRDFNDLRYYIDSTEIKKLGWKQEKKDIYQELKIVVDWYLRNPDYWKDLGNCLSPHQGKI